MQKVDVIEIKNKFRKFREYNFNNLENYTYYLLDEDYVEKLEDFFEKIVRKLSNPEIYIRNTMMENKDILKRGGMILAAFDADEIAAVLIVDAQPYEIALAKYKNSSPSDIKKSISFDTVCVANKYRGNHLQEILMSICEYLCLQKGYTQAYMSVSPYNYYSVRNAIRQGFNIFDIDYMYGNEEREPVARYILNLPLGKKMAEVEEQYSVLNSNIQAQRDVIDLGFVGMKVINFRAMDNFFVSYSKAFYEDCL